MKKTGEIKAAFIGTYPPGMGVSAYNYFLSAALSEHLKVTVIDFKKLYPSFLYKSTQKDESVNIKPPANVDLKRIVKWYSPLSWIKAGRIAADCDVVHAQWWSYVLAPAYITIFLVAKLKRRKIVLTIHNVKPHEQGLLKHFMNKSVFGFADMYIVHTKQNKEDLSNKYKISTSKIKVIAHGTLKAYNSKLEKNFSPKKFFKFDKNYPVILFFGNIRDYKGLDILLAAHQQMVKENQPFYLIIAGKVWGKWGRFEKYITPQSGKFIRTFFGYLPDKDLAKFFAASDVLALPYKEFDAHSGVLALAKSFSTPVIVSDLPNLMQAASTNHRYFFKSGDPSDLARAIKEATSQTKKVSHPEKQENDWVNIAANTVKLYEDLI